MPMAAPASTLTPFRICGFLEDACGEPARGRILVTLVNPDGGPVCDPTNGAFVSSSVVQNDAFEDGCWCTCDLLPSSAADPDAALQPNTTAYNIVINDGNTDVIDVTIPINVEEFEALPKITSDCGECVNIKELTNFTPSVPPSNQFKDAVTACLTALVAETGAVYGLAVDPDADCALLVTTDTGTSSLDLSAAIAACAPEVPPATGVATVGIDPASGCALLVTFEDGADPVSIDLTAAIEACSPASGVAGVIVDPAVPCGLLVQFADGTPDEPVDLAAVIAACAPTPPDPCCGELVADGDGNLIYDPGDGTGPQNPIAICDLLSAVNQVADPVENILVIGIDPVTGNCVAAPLPEPPEPSAPLDLGGLDPDTAGFPPTGYPEFELQTFTNGAGGSEIWVVLNDGAGVPQWVRVAP